MGSGGIAKIATVKIEVLYIQECPGYRPTLDAIDHIIAENRIEATVTAIEVTDPNTSGFAGSPTVLIDGKDIQRGALAAACGLACRTYDSDGKFQNTPSHNLLKAAIRRASGSGYSG